MVTAIKIADRAIGAGSPDCAVPHLETSPDPMLAAAVGSLAETFRPSCVFFAALTARLWAGITVEGVTADEVARRIGVSAVSARLLLNVVCADGLSRCDNGLYRLREDLRPLLSDGSDRVVEELLLYQRENGVWLRMASVLRGNEQTPVEYQRELLDSQIGRYPGVQALNRSIAREVVERIDGLVMNARRILDIGGGDGLYCDLLLRRNPNAVVRVLDLESGFAMCSRHTGYLRTGRLELEVGDGRSFHPTSQYDLVMINELLELFAAAEKREILKRGVASLRPGGHIAITKFTLRDNGIEPGGSAIFSLRMRLKTSEGYLETDGEVARALADYGCQDVQMQYVQSLKTIIIARRPDEQEATGARSAWRIVPGADEKEDAMQEPTELSEGQLGLWRELVGGATSFRMAAVLFAAAELDLFSHIPPEGCTTEQAAQSLSIPEVSARVLMNALAAMGIINQEAGRYSMHADLRVLLAKGPHSVLPEILHYRRENQVWLNLLQILRNDPGARADAAQALEAGHLSEYLTSVKMTNHGSAAKLTRRLKPLLSGVRRVLDIGGGSGDYAKMLLATSPDLKVTLLDRPEVLAQCQTALGPEIQTGRIELIAGDALDFHLAATHDIALISDLLHYFSYEDKRRLVFNAKESLLLGGAVVVSKFTLEDGGISPPSAALFSLKIHVKRPEAYLETDHEVVAIMQSVGLEEVTVEALDKDKSLVIGKRRGH
jgi:trans-aconitate methyltransferase